MYQPQGNDRDDMKQRKSKYYPKALLCSSTISVFCCLLLCPCLFRKRSVMLPFEPNMYKRQHSQDIYAGFSNSVALWCYGIDIFYVTIDSCCSYSCSSSFADTLALGVWTGFANAPHPVHRQCAVFAIRPNTWPK